MKHIIEEIAKLSSRMGSIIKAPVMLLMLLLILLTGMIGIGFITLAAMFLELLDRWD